jgi:hypothetical protein
LKSNGDGSFAAPVLITHSTTYGRGAARGKLRDLDGDGDLDILYNDAHTDFFTGYDFWTALNDGTGTFSEPVEWDLGTGGNGDIDAFDLDNDGDLDVVNLEELSAGGTTPQRIFIRLNNGDATFQPQYFFAIDPIPHDLGGGDFNEDGNVDLVSAHWGVYGANDFLNVHIGNGDGTFQEEVEYKVGKGPRWITVNDFDDDGHLDFATANSSDDNTGRETMTVIFGVGDGTFTGRTDYYAPYAPDLQGVHGITAGDVDADGDLDLMVATTANGLAMYYNDGAGNFTFPHRLGAYAGPWDPVYADFDGDEIEDLALITSIIPSGLGREVAILRGIDLGGGGIPCADTFKLQARCTANQAGVNKLQVRLVLFDASHSGEQVTMTIDGVEHVLTINGSVVSTLVNNAAPGPHSIILTEPAGCFPEKTVVCPGGG